MEIRASQTGVAFVGCGYVADLYVRTLRLHPGIKLIGVTDRDQGRAQRFSSYYAVPAFGSLTELLQSPEVTIVVNLTNPSSHFEVNRAALEAGKHVYSEKPLSMDFGQARQLVAMAQARSLQISSAPCNLLSQTAQTLWRALRSGAVGRVRLVYAELDEGMIHRMPYQKWCSESGAPWPYQDEFEVGCTMEHAAYYLSWLVAFFGPAESVTAFSACLIPDKQTPTPLRVESPDFSVACVRFASGVVARLTCGIVAPHDHSLQIVGDEGLLSVRECWDYASPVRLRRRLTIRRRVLLSPWSSRMPTARTPYPQPPRFGAARMDFARGIAEMADAIAEGQAPYLSAQFCLHVNELVLAIQNAGARSGTYMMTTTCETPAPCGELAPRTVELTAQGLAT